MGNLFFSCWVLEDFWNSSSLIALSLKNNFGRAKNDEFVMQWPVWLWKEDTFCLSQELEFIFEGNLCK